MPLTPAPTPAFSGGIALMMALAIAGIARATPAPITTRPNSMPPYPPSPPPSTAIAARPAARQLIPAAMTTGVPNFRTMRAPRPVRLRTTTVSAIGAVRRPASNGP